MSMEPINLFLTAPDLHRREGVLRAVAAELDGSAESWKKASITTE
jgi:hypothetical protein